MSAQQTHWQAFALAGQIVKDWREARRIQFAAMRDGREWVVPQARNVAIKLKRAAEARAAIAKATGVQS